MKILAFFVVALSLLAPLRSQTAEAAPASAGPGEQTAVVVDNKGPGTDGQTVIVTNPTTEFIEHLVDNVLFRFHVPQDENTPERYAISVGILVLSILVRTVVVMLLFSLLAQLAKHTNTTLDDRLFTSLRSPVATLVVVIGAVAAVKALKLSPTVDHTLSYVYTVAFSLCIFWLLFRAFTTILDHLAQIVVTRQLGVAAFMPWIKKTLIVFFLIIGALTVAQSLGADVKTFIAGLGIGGLAFALAAQDTLANVFGSVVVAIDRPFKLGDTIKIGSNVGAVEEIGLRSTRLRLVDKSLLIVPNKTVASESIVNLAFFTQRRFEQTIGLTYDSKPEQIESIVEAIRGIIKAEDFVDPGSVIVQFTEFAASSLNIWMIFQTKDGDFQRAIKTRQRINLNIMREVEARGLAFAYPTQRLQLESISTLQARLEEPAQPVNRSAGPQDSKPSSG